jgi:hypothetical protein
MPIIVGLIATLIACQVGPAAAYDWRWGELDGRFDSTFSFGVQLRTESPSTKNYCTTIGGPNVLDPGNVVPDGAGDGPGANGDCGKSEGNLNYDQWKPTSTILKGIHELDLTYKSYSAFVRFQWWYDGINQNGDRARTPLTDDAKWQMGAGAQLLDAYIQGNWYPGNIPVSLKFGNVVLNWGESTFLQNGISVINPIDVRRLRVPGAELRDAYIAVPMAWASVSPTDSITFEGFYQWWWKNTIIDPPGTFFSTHDALGPGGQYFDISQGRNDCDTNNPFDLDPVDGVFFGPTQAGPNFFNCIQRGPNDGARNHGQYGFAARFFLPGAAGTELGVFFLNVHSRLPYTGGIIYQTFPQTGNDINEVLRQSRASQFYPEDVKKVGASFSTGWDRASLAFQGEFAYAINQPLQISEIEVLSALLAASQIPLPISTAPGTPQATPGEFYEGAVEKDVVTVQATMTYVGEPGRVVGDWLRASQFLFITEFGYMRIVGFDDPSDLPLQASVTPQEAPPIPGGLNTATQLSSFATQNSLGYVIRAALPYNNLIWGVNVKPFIGWSHGVWGHSPAPLLNYSQDSMSVNIGVNFEYQNAWASTIGYTSFFGGGVNNPRNDRDFLSFDIKYSF